MPSTLTPSSPPPLQISFFLGSKRSATVRAACWSSVLHLERDDVDELLRERAHLHERARLHRMVEEMAKKQAQDNANKGPSTQQNTSARARGEEGRERMITRVWRRQIISKDSRVSTSPPARSPLRLTAFPSCSNPHPTSLASHFPPCPSTSHSPPPYPSPPRHLQFSLPLPTPSHPLFTPLAKCGLSSSHRSLPSLPSSLRPAASGML